MAHAVSGFCLAATIGIVIFVLPDVESTTVIVPNRLVVVLADAFSALLVSGCRSVGTYRARAVDPLRQVDGSRSRVGGGESGHGLAHAGVAQVPIPEDQSGA